MIDTIKNMPDVKIKIVDKGQINETSSKKIGDRKKIIIFWSTRRFYINLLN